MGSSESQVEEKDTVHKGIKKSNDVKNKINTKMMNNKINNIQNHKNNLTKVNDNKLKNISIKNQNTNAISNEQNQIKDENDTIKNNISDKYDNELKLNFQNQNVKNLSLEHDKKYILDSKLNIDEQDEILNQDFNEKQYKKSNSTETRNSQDNSSQINLTKKESFELILNRVSIHSINQIDNTKNVFIDDQKENNILYIDKKYEELSNKNDLIEIKSDNFHNDNDYHEFENANDLSLINKSINSNNKKQSIIADGQYDPLILINSLHTGECNDTIQNQIRSILISETLILQNKNYKIKDNLENIEDQINKLEIEQIIDEIEIPKSNFMLNSINFDKINTQFTNFKQSKQKVKTLVDQDSDEENQQKNKTKVNFFIKKSIAQKINGLNQVIIGKFYSYNYCENLNKAINIKVSQDYIIQQKKKIKYKPPIISISTDKLFNIKKSQTLVKRKSQNNLNIIENKQRSINIDIEEQNYLINQNDAQQNSYVINEIDFLEDKTIDYSLVDQKQLIENQNDYVYKFQTKFIKTTQQRNRKLDEIDFDQCNKQIKSQNKIIRKNSQSELEQSKNLQNSKISNQENSAFNQNFQKNIKENSLQNLIKQKIQKQKELNIYLESLDLQKETINQLNSIIKVQTDDTQENIDISNNIILIDNLSEQYLQDILDSIILEECRDEVELILSHIRLATEDEFDNYSDRDNNEIDMTFLEDQIDQILLSRESNENLNNILIEQNQTSDDLINIQRSFQYRLK